MPTKATYELFDADPSEEFDHWLCVKLGWRSVEVMRRRMSAAEWNRWRIFYGRRAQERELAEMRARG